MIGWLLFWAIWLGCGGLLGVYVTKLKFTDIEDNLGAEATKYFKYILGVVSVVSGPAGMIIAVMVTFTEANY